MRFWNDLNRIDYLESESNDTKNRVFVDIIPGLHFQTSTKWRYFSLQLLWLKIDSGSLYRQKKNWTYFQLQKIGSRQIYNFNWLLGIHMELIISSDNCQRLFWKIGSWLYQYRRCAPIFKLKRLRKNYIFGFIWNYWETFHKKD